MCSHCPPCLNRPRTPRLFHARSRRRFRSTCAGLVRFSPEPPPPNAVCHARVTRRPWWWVRCHGLCSKCRLPSMVMVPITPCLTRRCTVGCGVGFSGDWECEKCENQNHHFRSALRQHALRQHAGAIRGHAVEIVERQWKGSGRAVKGSEDTRKGSENPSVQPPACSTPHATELRGALPFLDLLRPLCQRLTPSPAVRLQGRRQLTVHAANIDYLPTMMALITSN